MGDKQYRVGQGVHHAWFGEGTIIGLSGAGQTPRLEIQFRRRGAKTLALGIAKLDIVQVAYMANNDSPKAELASLRAEVDEIDQQIMLLLGVRFRCTDMIGELKRELGMDLVDPQRRGTAGRAHPPPRARGLACRPRLPKPSCAK